MSFKKFSSEAGTPKKDNPDDKRKDAPATELPDKTSVEVAPTPKP
jgi:hypothetical protein